MTIIEPLKSLDVNCECGARISRFSVEQRHTNGHFNQIFEYKCGRRDRWSPNFMDWDPHSSYACPNSEESRKKERERAMVAAIEAMNKVATTVEDKLVFVNMLKERVEDQL